MDHDHIAASAGPNGATAEGPGVMAPNPAAVVDAAMLEALVGRILGDLGGAFSVPLVRIGTRWGSTATSARGSRSPPRSWPTAPAPRRATSPSGSRRRPPRAT